MVEKTILGIKSSYLLLFILVATIGTAFYLGESIEIPQALIQGGDYLSISQVQKVNDPNSGVVTSTLWRVETIYGSGGTVSLVGYNYKTRNDFISTLTGEKSSDRLIIESGMTKQVCNYPYQSEQIKSPQYQTLGGVSSITLKPGDSKISGGCAIGLLGQTVTQQNTKDPVYLPSSCTSNTNSDYKLLCREAGGYTVTSSIATNTFGITGNDKIGVACVRILRDLSKPTIAYLRPFQKDVDFEIVSTLTNSKGEKETLVLDDSNPIVISRDSKVKGSFKGALSALNQECPSESGFELIRTDTGYSSIVAKSNYDNLPEVPNFATETPSTLDQATQKVNAYNAKLDGILSPNVDLTKQNTDFEGLPVSLSSGKIVVDRIGKPVAFPIVVYDISTQFLGVYEPLSKPEISEIRPNSITIQEAGSRIPVTVYVVNNGDRANVNVGVKSCSSPNVAIPGAQRLVMNPGDRNSFDFFFGGTKGTYTCTFIAYDDNKQYVSQEKTVGITINAQCSAVPEGNKQVKYNPDGTCQLYCPLTENSCKANEKLVDCVCQPVSCVPDRNLKECESFNPATCQIEVKDGYSLDVFGTCKVVSQSTEPSQSGAVTCQEQVDKVSCSTLDVGCEVGKAFKRASCLVIDIGQVLAMLCLGTIILGGILVFTIKKRK